jgi:single-strand DNA-binding protein
MYNKIIIIGNLTKDAEFKTVGKSRVAKLRLACDDPFKQNSTLFIECEAWNEQADFAEKWLKKGKGVIIDGRLCMDSWEKDGKKESKFYIRVQDIRFSTAGKREDDDKQSKPTQSQKTEKVEKKQVKQTEEDEFSDVPF